MRRHVCGSALSRLWQHAHPRMCFGGWRSARGKRQFDTSIRERDVLSTGGFLADLTPQQKRVLRITMEECVLSCAVPCAPCVCVRLALTVRG